MANPTLLIFVHGWSVTSTKTYGGLPEALATNAAGAGVNLDIRHIYLGRYISFHDEVSMDDLAIAMDHALRTDIPNNANGKRKFSCITHSTGGPLVRAWLDKFYGADKLKNTPLRHLIMLAPANHGSALAAIGKTRVGRLKSWFTGVEPGQRVLDWLCLGSDGQWDLNNQWIDYPVNDTAFFPVVLSGESIDEKFYDFVNPYLVEKGSDGVVRLAAANMNFTQLTMHQTEDIIRNRPKTTHLSFNSGSIKRAETTAFGVIPDASHSGARMGIMNSVKDDASPTEPILDELFAILSISTKKQYHDYIGRADALTSATQNDASQYSMLVFNVRDNAGNMITDYDLLILAGNRFEPNKLPKGFFVDKQKNKQSEHRIVYYVDHNRMQEIRDGKIGFRIIARPDKGFAWYEQAEFRGDGLTVDDVVRPNETVYIDIILKRHVDSEAFRLGSASKPRISFKKARSKGNSVA